MFGFTRALGVRCSYCHKGEEGKPVSTYDFASDENPNKNRAREMLRMLNEIEVHLNKIEPSGYKRVNMSHLRSWPPETHDPRRGTRRTVSKEGFASGARYAGLKKKYYGRAAFDFGEGSLNVSWLHPA
jgi:hypothetical protein